MADTATKDLTAASAALATDRMPCAISPYGATDNRYLTPAQLGTYAGNAAVFAAGSASASTWPKLTSGTLLTTAEAGALELDANCLYGTTDAGNRGVIPLQHIVRQDAFGTLATPITTQKLFDSVTNGRLTLETGCYLFESLFHVNLMDNTVASNLGFVLLGAGTATLAAVLYHVIGRDQTAGVAGSATGSLSIASTSVASIVTGTTIDEVFAQITGTFEVTAAGTLIPSITFATTASNPSLAAGSFFSCQRIGSTSLTTVGQWD